MFDLSVKGPKAARQKCVKKPTKFMTNSRIIAREINRKCPKHINTRTWLGEGPVPLRIFRRNSVKPYAEACSGKS
jgi:hypothetical protein